MDTLFSYQPKQIIELPLFLERVACGFPSPAQDYVEIVSILTGWQ